MRANGISLQVLNSFSKSQKVLGLQDIFDYIAYNDSAVVAQLLCSDKIKQSYLTYSHGIYNNSAFDFDKEYNYEYTESVIRLAYQQAYPSMDLLNSNSTSFKFDVTKRSESINKALDVLFSVINSNDFGFFEKSNLTKKNIDLNDLGNIKLPDVSDVLDVGYTTTETFFKIIELDDTVFVVIKPEMVLKHDSNLNEYFFNEEWFSSCSDIGENEPTAMRENLFVKLMSVVSKNGRQSDWAYTGLGKFYFKVFVIT